MSDSTKTSNSNKLLDNMHKELDDMHKELLSKPTLKHHIAIGVFIVLGTWAGLELVSMDWNF